MIQELRYCLIAIITILSFTLPVQARTLNIALITDGEKPLISGMTDIFQQEITQLLEGLRTPQYQIYHSDFQSQKYADTLNQVYRNRNIDMVIVLGIGSTQTAVKQGVFNKPTFLPHLFSAQFYGLPITGGSGIDNLNYLAGKISFDEEIKTFSAIQPFKKAALVVDGNALNNLPKAMLKDFKTKAASQGVTLIPIAMKSDSAQALIDILPSDIDAVLSPAMPRLNAKQKTQLISSLARKKIGVYALAGKELLNHGALASSSPDTDIIRLARTIGLNIQSTVRGQKVSRLAVDFNFHNELTISMAAARKINLSIPYDVLATANLVNEDPKTNDKPLTLSAAAEIAFSANLDILAQQVSVDIAKQQMLETQSALKPQVSLNATATQRKDDSAAVASGALAERDAVASLTLSQLLYSETTHSAIDQSKYNIDAVKANLRQVELNIIQQATVSFLNYLKAKTNVKTQRNNTKLSVENLKQAQQKLDIGSGTRTDVLNWQNQVANAKRTLLASESNLQQSREALNIILHRPLNASFNTEPATLNYPNSLAGNKRLEEIIINPKSFWAMGRVMENRAIDNAPELKQFEALLAAKKRELKSARALRWSPTISANAQVNTVFEDNRQTAANTEGDSDWNVNLQLGLPFYQGGKINASSHRARSELRQLELQYKQRKDQIIQTVRNNLHALNASYPSIELASQSATAADEAYQLMQLAYDEGSVSILDLIDAQNNALNANQQAEDASYNMLIDLMNLQRSYGEFDFFIDEKTRQSFIDDVVDRLK